MPLVITTDTAPDIALDTALDTGAGRDLARRRGELGANTSVGSRRWRRVQGRTGQAASWRGALGCVLRRRLPSLACDGRRFRRGSQARSEAGRSRARIGKLGDEAAAAVRLDPARRADAPAGCGFTRRAGQGRRRSGCRRKASTSRKAGGSRKPGAHCRLCKPQPQYPSIEDLRWMSGCEGHAYCRSLFCKTQQLDIINRIVELVAAGRCTRRRAASIGTLLSVLERRQAMMPVRASKRKTSLA